MDPDNEGYKNDGSDDEQLSSDGEEMIIQNQGEKTRNSSVHKDRADSRNESLLDIQQINESILNEKGTS